MKIRWSRESTSDLAKIRAYIGKDSISAAERVRSQIIETIRQLQLLPRLGHVGHRAGTRELSVPHLPYIVVYQLVGNELVILGIFHGAQDRKTTT